MNHVKKGHRHLLVLWLAALVCIQPRHALAIGECADVFSSTRTSALNFIEDELRQMALGANVSPATFRKQLLEQDFSNPEIGKALVAKIESFQKWSTSMANANGLPPQHFTYEAIGYLKIYLDNSAALKKPIIEMTEILNKAENSTPPISEFLSVWNETFNL